MDKYNSFTVLDEFSDKRRVMWKVQCDCGKVEVRRRDLVIKGYSKSCRSCASKRNAKTHPPPVRRTGCNGLSGTHFKSIRHGASRRGIVFDVTPEYLWGLYESQNGLCALTGVPIILNTSIKNQNVNWDVITASLDRIDSDVGYVVGNLWWVHKEMNRLKNNYTLEELLYWSSLLVEKHGKHKGKQ